MKASCLSFIYKNTKDNKGRGGAGETVGGESTLLESGPETNLHSNENTTLSTTSGPDLWDLPGFPGGAEKFLRAGLCEKEVGLHTERQKVRKAVFEIRGGKQVGRRTRARWREERERD